MKNDDKIREVNLTYGDLFQKIGFAFNDYALLELAFTHCSYNGNDGENNQRLEFLGDAVLEFVVSERLYRRCKLDEGYMTRIRASVVCEQSLAQAARELDLGKYLLLGKGEEGTQGREKSSILADTMESLIGAILIDAGLEQAKGFIMQTLGRRLDETIEDGGGSDYKTELQQMVSTRYSTIPDYRILAAQGPPHNKTFKIGVYVKGNKLGEGEAKTKKEAEQTAAKKAIGKIAGRRK